MDMNEPRIMLTQRYGYEIESPSTADLKVAIRQLYDGTMNGAISDAHFALNGIASLHVEHELGPVFRILIDRNRKVVFEEWSSETLEEMPAPSRRRRNVAEHVAIQLWIWLASGQIDQVRSFFAK